MVRRREPVVHQAPGPPAGASLAELEVWRRDVFEPWLARMRARAASRALTGRSTGRDRQVAEMRAAALAEIADRIAADRRPVTERVPEIFPEILNGSSRS